MKAIILGAGRGQRLMPHTDGCPKCFIEVEGRRLLDWGLEALKGVGLDVVFVGGYLVEKVEEAYPELTYCYNADWRDTNILFSLMQAEPYMGEGFVCAYADILYRPGILRALMKSPHEITLACDTAWRKRYALRTEHPKEDAEKMTAEGDGVIRIARDVPNDVARGEYIGVARFGAEGAEALRDAYHHAKATYDGHPFRSAAMFKKAYSIDLFQEMIDDGAEMHLVETEGGYFEIDTVQDYEIARREWTR